MDCIITTRCLSKQGYGKLRRNGKDLLAHRVAYAEHHGLSMDDIAGVVIRHTCDNPACINPAHLLPGTTQDNVDDKVSRGRQARGTMLPQTVLTPEQIAEIRRRFTKRCPVNGGAALGREFGVTTTYICILAKQSFA